MKDHAKDLSQVYKPEIDEGFDFVKLKAEKKFNEKFGKKVENTPTEGKGFKKSKKGSAEMKEGMAKLRGMRLKKGGNIWSDMASGLIHQGIPAVTGVLGGIAGEVLGGPLGGVAGGVSGSEIGKMDADAIGKSTGYGLGMQPEKIHAPYMQIISGLPVAFPKSAKTTKGGRVVHGGSFLAI